MILSTIVDILANSRRKELAVAAEINKILYSIFFDRPGSLVETTDVINVNQAPTNANITVPLSKTNMILLGGVLGGVGAIATIWCLMPYIVSLFNTLGNITITEGGAANLVEVVGGSGQAPVEQVEMFDFRTRMLGFFTRIYLFNRLSNGGNLNGNSNIYSTLYINASLYINGNPYIGVMMQNIINMIETPTLDGDNMQIGSPTDVTSYNGRYLD